jgi:hypothetical protein
MRIRSTINAPSTAAQAPGKIETLLEAIDSLKFSGANQAFDSVGQMRADARKVSDAFSAFVLAKFFDGKRQFQNSLRSPTICFHSVKASSAGFQKVGVIR